MPRPHALLKAGSHGSVDTWSAGRIVSWSHFAARRVARSDGQMVRRSETRRHRNAETQKVTRSDGGDGRRLVAAVALRRPFDRTEAGSHRSRLGRTPHVSHDSMTPMPPGPHDPSPQALAVSVVHRCGRATPWRVFHDVRHCGRVMIPPSRPPPRGPPQDDWMRMKKARRRPKPSAEPFRGRGRSRKCTPGRRPRKGREGEIRKELSLNVTLRNCLRVRCRPNTLIRSCRTLPASLSDPSPGRLTPAATPSRLLACSCPAVAPPHRRCD